MCNKPHLAFSNPNMPKTVTGKDSIFLYRFNNTMKDLQLEPVATWGKRFVNADWVPNNTTQYRLPCGQCYGCKIKKSRDWQARITSHLKKYGTAYFVTLTYSDSELKHYDDDEIMFVDTPRDFTNDLQKFWKRLRKFGMKLQYFASFEYGSKSKRPHFHAILFTEHDLELKNVGDTDKIFSLTLRKFWPHGFNTCYPLKDAAQVAYTTGYAIKKIMDGSKPVRGERGLHVRKYSKENHTKYFYERIYASQGIGYNYLEEMEKADYLQDMRGMLNPKTGNCYTYSIPRSLLLAYERNTLFKMSATIKIERYREAKARAAPVYATYKDEENAFRLKESKIIEKWLDKMKTSI